MDKSILPVRKICRIIAVEQPRIDGPKDRVIEELHLLTNALMYEKGIVRSILALFPILGEIAPQGVKERLLFTGHPPEAAQILLVFGQVLFDSSMSTWTPCEMEQKINGLIEAMEAVLGAEKGTFEPMKQILAAGSGCILQESKSRRDE